MDLGRYHEMRDFAQTPEPAGAGSPSPLAPRYAMQKHAATRLHFDLRLEHEGALLSWAVTRGPSLDPADKRLAVRTEDHPLTYLTFEGTIPPRNYGAGTVMLWDIGWWQPLIPVGQGLRDGKLHFALHGRRNTGNWKLIRMKGGKPADKGRENWLLLKEEDEAAHGPDPVATHVTSVATGRMMEAIAAGAAPRPFGPPRSRPAPRFRKPQLATRAKDPPDSALWWHELKLDGYRALVPLGKDGARVMTRNGHDWSDRFAPLVPAFEDLPASSALIDGEIVAGAGVEGFAGLQAAIKAGGPFRFFAFDLLHLDGADLAARPLTERRAALEVLMADVPPLGLLQLSPVFDAPARQVLDTICAAGGEGLIAKLRDAPYRAGRGTAWIKVKCDKGDEFVICGVQPSDKRGRPFASLLLATQEKGGLVYRGKVGTGFDDSMMATLAAAMAPLAQAATALAQPPADLPRGVQWLRPTLVAEIRYAELTPEGRLRHARFVALRGDKPATEVRLDDPDRAGSGKPGAGRKRGGKAAMAKGEGMAQDKGRPLVAGIGISNGERVIFARVGRRAAVTKLDLARYYDAIADRMLPAVADRPLSLLRLPEGLEGERFFQKHAGKGFPAAIRTLPVPEKDGGTADYMAVTTGAGLVGAVQMGTVEFHIWGARRDMLERPDRMVLDLDPDEGMGFAPVRRAAADLAADLAAIGLPSWPLVTGGKGVHVVVPLRRVAEWDTVKLFARTFATVQAERAPDRFVATMSKARRKDRIFIDWLRNERGATAVAPFSVRARPGAPVAVPVSWDELAGLRRADAFDMGAALARDGDRVALPAPVALSGAVIARLGDWAGG